MVHVRKQEKESEPLEIENAVVGTRITRPMYDALIKFLTLDSHITISDYLRDLLRRDLEQKGFLKTECPA